jgi:hypothetical protein
VSNLAVDYEDFASRTANSSRETNIHIEKYRTFVGNNPDKSSYFQPVLDKLEVIPSRLDSLKPCVLVEGKGDYLILEYGRHLLGLDKTNYAIVPTRGADHFDEIVGIFLGWGVNYALCFDDDSKGRKSLKEYVDNWAVGQSRAFTLKDISPELTGRAIEGVVSDSDIQMIAHHYGIVGSPTKSQIQLFFSEKLALRELITLSERFRSSVLAFDARVKLALQITE